jgi:hypothetical protein
MNTLGWIVFFILSFVLLALCGFWVFVVYLEITDNLDILDR